MPLSIKEYNWDPEVYQKKLSFIPKLANKIIQWLELDKDDVILDLGCGNGVLDADFCHIISRGSGRLVGIDSSLPMIEVARKAAAVAVGSSEVSLDKVSFEVMDATALVEHSHLQKGEFTKVFSSYAMHWIMGPPDRRVTFIQGVKNALKPGGTFVFDMGGCGHISEIRAAILAAVAKRVGLENIVEPWFSPDEAWMKTMLEETVGGFKVERSEVERRSMWADQEGCNGLVRLVGAQLFDLAPEAEREECIKEAAGVVDVVCKTPGGGHAFNYVGLRMVARKL